MTTYTYQGNGAYLPGIPARDLAERDVARLDDDQLALAETSGLYTKVQALDPLGEISDDAFEQLSPAEKGARTRKANELREPAQQQGDSNGAAGASATED